MEQTWTWAQLGWALLEWAKIVVDLLKAYAWPLAAFALVWLFRKEIRPLLPLMRELGPGGVKFDPPPQQLTPKTQGSDLQTVPKHAMNTVNELMLSIEEDLKKYDDPDFRQSLLVANLAQARVEANFEFLFGMIFQSQINALRELVTRPITRNDARKMYETIVIPSNPQLYSHLDFDAWSRFLISQELVKVEGETFTISSVGRDFLLFVDTKKVGMTRPT